MTEDDGWDEDAGDVDFSFMTKKTQDKNEPSLADEEEDFEGLPEDECPDPDEDDLDFEYEAIDLYQIRFLFILLTKVCVADGEFSRLEAKDLESKLRRQGFDEEGLNFAYQTIKEAKEDDKSAVEYAKEFLSWCQSKAAERGPRDKAMKLKDWLILNLVSIALADEDFSEEERNVISEVIEALNLPPEYLDQTVRLVRIREITYDIKTKGCGSAFFITEDGYLITNEHVVQDSKNIIIRTRDALLSAEVVKTDADEDLCLLKVPVSAQPHVKFPKSPSYLGQKIFTLGFPAPNTLGFEMNLTSGVVSSTTGFQDDPRDLQVDATIHGGNSGGPLFCEATGALAGVNTAGIDPSFLDNVAYARKAERVKKFLEDCEEINLSTLEEDAEEEPRDKFFQYAQNCVAQVFQGMDNAEMWTSKVLLDPNSGEDNPRDSIPSVGKKLFWIARGGQKHGPYTREQIDSFLDEEQIGEEDSAWTKGASGWQPLKNLL